MNYFLMLFCLWISVAFAGENDRLHRPKSFSISGGKAVFADFSRADYFITYDLIQKKAYVRAQIELETSEDGFPVFDSVAIPSGLSLNGKSVSSLEVNTPQNETTLRVVNKLVRAGTHHLEIDVPLTNLIEFTETGVKSAFWTSDLRDRRFLEAYMPANFEFDQVKMTFFITFIGEPETLKQNIYTNGTVTKTNYNTYKITYPHYYTSSSIFFHTVPEGTTSELRFSLRSIDGREIPSIVYLSKSTWNGNLERIKAKTIEVFHELEKDYGPFPHPSITVYQAGSGGMEYCGATMTDFSALGHELFHSYFARAVMPANGNSGWIDEALASWRDYGYKTLQTLLGTSSMSSHPYYTRTTDMAAYTFGERFMRYLDGQLKFKGGLKPFMRHMVEKRSFAPLFVEEFIKEMSDFYGVSLEEEFKKFTYTQSNVDVRSEKSSSSVHRKMTLKELRQYL